MGVAVTSVAAWIKGGLSQLGMFWDVGAEWATQRKGESVPGLGPRCLDKSKTDWERAAVDKAGGQRTRAGCKTDCRAFAFTVPSAWGNPFQRGPFAHSG